MKKNNDLSYENIVNNLKNDNIYVPETREYQALSREKTKEFVLKCISGALIIVGIGTTALGCAKKNSNKDQTNASIVTEGEEPESLNYEFVLETPFANGEEKLIVDDVNKNNKKDDSTSKDLTERMVKFFNGTLTKDDFKGMSDKEIIKEVRYYTDNMLDVLSASIADFNQIQDGTSKKYNKDVKAVAFTLFDKNSYVYKTYLRQYDGSVLNEQKSDIVNGNKKDFTINAEAYGELGKKMLSDKNITVYEKALIAKILKADYPLFSRYLSKELKEFYQKEFDSSYFTQAMNDWFNKYAIATDVLGADCDKVKEGEQYNAADTKAAEALAGSTGEKGRTEKGGKKIGTSSEVIQKSKDTGSYSSSTVVNKDKETTETVTKQGGKVVDEEVVTKPPKVIDEEDVQPGYDPIESSTYTEDEWKRRNESSSKTTTTTTTTKNESNDSSDDRDSLKILTEDEWLRYLGMSSIGLGGFVGVIPKIKKRK